MARNPRIQVNGLIIDRIMIGVTNLEASFNLAVDNYARHIWEWEHGIAEVDAMIEEFEARDRWIKDEQVKQAARTESD